MEEKKHLTYLDDDLTNLNIIQQALSPRYRVNCTNSPGDFLREDDPNCDILLLDVDMPEINGYEVCEILRDKNFDKPVLFLSAHDDLEDRLKGYSAGGNEYISKPFNIEELILKLDKNLEQYQQLDITKEKLHQANNTAMTAITNASEMGVAISFTQKVQSCREASDLSDCLKDALAAYGLSAVFSFRMFDEVLYYSAGNKTLTELEKELLDAYERCGKVASYGFRCLLSSANISVLIKNMPDDLGKTGRLRDHLALLLDTAQHQLNFLNTKHQNQEQQDMFMSSLQQNMQELITKIDTSIGHSRERADNVVEKIKQELHGLELQLDLPEENSVELQNISDQLQSDLDVIFDEFDNIEKQLGLLIGAIQNFRPF